MKPIDTTLEPTLSPAEVDNLLSTFGKALRAFTMYQSNNPVFQRFRQSLREAFARIWQQAGSLELLVQEDGFKYGGQTFVVGKGRENLSFLFYKDGIRHLTFLPGFEDEVAEFVDAVNRALRNDRDAEDLISVLWEKDFSSLQYGYVDMLAEGLAVPSGPKTEPHAVQGAAYRQEVAEAEAEAEAQQDGAGEPSAPKMGLSREDFDETLYFLDQAEMATLQEEVQIEMERDLKRDVLNALFDRLEETGRTTRQAEILDILDQLLPLFLGRGDLRYAAVMLDELDSMSKTGALGADHQDRVTRVFGRLSEPDVLEQFVQALETGGVDPRSEDVNLFFSRLRPEALPVLIRFAEVTQAGGVKSRLEAAIDGLAVSHPAEVARLLASNEPTVVGGAARVAGRTGLGQAVPALQGALGHADRAVRMAVVDALIAIRSTTALQSLVNALEDADREIRITSARALGAFRFASARDRLSALIDGNGLKNADLTEKMAVYEAFGAAGGSAAVERLEKILHHKGMLGRRMPADVRACAALGLGQAGTPQARQALERAKADEDPVVRNAVLRALAQEVPAR